MAWEAVTSMKQEGLLPIEHDTPNSTLWPQQYATQSNISAFPVAKVLRDRIRSRRSTRVLAFLADLLALTIAFLGAGVVRFGEPLHGNALNTLGAVLPIYFIIAINSRCFHLDAVARARIGARDATVALLVALSVVGLVAFFLSIGAELSRAVFGTGAVAALILIPSFRFAAVRIGRVLFGEASPCNLIIEDGVRIPSANAMVLDAKLLRLEPKLDDPVMLDRLGRSVEGADRVIVACPPERRAFWAIALKGADVNAEVVDVELYRLGAIGISSFEGESTLIVAASPLGAMDRTLKRILDLTLTIAVLPLALPLMAVVAIAIRVDSPGSILFKQMRVGLGNRIFHIYKFRSMYAERTDALGDHSARRDDDRITRVGRFIRATSIDELPQLFNVLSGSMSIVGPRPHPLLSKAEDRLFWDIDRTYWHRHAVKPGLTGLAQVRGFRGATHKESDLTNRLQADLEYLSGWTIWRDIAIILATFKVLAHRNAY